MKITWQIDAGDVAKVKAFCAGHQDNPFVRKRIQRNLRLDKPPVTQSQFWECMVGCLLTTQQRSGPDTPVSRFLLTRPFPLEYETCLKNGDLATFARTVISKFGGLRRATNIGKELAANLAFLKTGGWEAAFTHLEAVRLHPSPETERSAALFLDERLSGIGPKQSRNLLQGLGLSRYEIPIDSRITKWLNDFGFPVRLTANPLGDANYYNFISEGFRRLAEACGIVPCVLDAVIFSSFDGEKWTDDNIAW
jgi:hypothetical protein